MRVQLRGQSRERGFALVLALFVVGLLLIAGMLMLSNSQFSAADTINTEQKNQAFDGAEAGLDSAMEALDINPGSSSSGSGTIANGETFTYTINNNLISSSAKSVPGRGSIPGDSALITSVGVGSAGGRPVTIDSVVIPSSTQITFSNDAVDAGLDIQGNWNNGNCIGFSGSGGSNNANIHANGNITANSCFTDGQASASGTVTGSVNAVGGTFSGTPQVQLPTAQMATFVSAEKTQAQSSPPLYPNDYIASGGSLPTTYNCPVSALPTGCVVFVDSGVSMAGHASATFSGKVIVVINGSYSAAGQALLAFQSGQKSVLVVNGNADIGGNGSAAALIWAKGDITLHGNGALSGAAVAGGNVNLLGGGNGGGLTYDATLQNTTLGTQGKLVIATYGEY